MDPLGRASSPSIKMEGMFNSVSHPTRERVTSSSSSYKPSQVPVSSLQIFQVVVIDWNTGAESVKNMFAVGY